jgi:CTD small phosphatase-like protein 2
MSSLVNSIYAQPNSPIASAKKKTPVKQAKSPNAPSSATKSLSSSWSGRGLIMAITGLFSPKPSKDEMAETKTINTPESMKSVVDKGNDSASKASTSSESSDSGVLDEHLVDADSSDDDVDEGGFDDGFNPYFYIGRLPPLSSVMRHKPALPAINSSSKYTLTLDLDETLVHCSVEPLPKPDYIFPVNFNGQTYQIYARKRPYLEYFLKTVAKHFEVVVFTASQRIYADKLLDYLDPTNTLVQHRLFRDSCVCVGGNYIKDLQVLGRSLNTTLLVDNSPHAYGYNTDNGVPIESWFDDDTDTELLKLIGFLRRITPDMEDVRPLIRDHFKTHKIIQKALRGGKCPAVSPPF